MEKNDIEIIKEIINQCKYFDAKNEDEYLFIRKKIYDNIKRDFFIGIPAEEIISYRNDITSIDILTNFISMILYKNTDFVHITHFSKRLYQ